MCICRVRKDTARLAPSGPTTSPVANVDWATGTDEWLLRGDVYTRALISGFDGDTATPRAKKLSGVYGRILLRGSDLTAQGKAPDRRAFDQYETVRTYWPEPQGPGTAMLGASTEFQGIDWELSGDGFGRLKSAGQSRLRFGRYFWPTPVRPGVGIKNFEPFPYMAFHYTDLNRMDLIGLGSQNKQYDTFFRPQGRPGVPKYRDDAKILIYSLADLAPIPVPRQPQRIQFRTPFENPYTVFGKTALFIISWLDGWSGVCNGPPFSPSAPSGYQTTPFSANDAILTCPSLTNQPLSPHLLEFNGARIRSQIENRAVLGPSQNFVDLRTTMRCAWNSPPGSREYRESVERTGRAGYDMNLFSTGADENGNAQLYWQSYTSQTHPLGVV